MTAVPLGVSVPSATLVEAGVGVAGVAESTVTLTPGAGLAYDTSGWTSLGGGLFSMAGFYGSAVLDTGANSLVYSLDDALDATNALAGGQSVADGFDVRVTDGVTSATQPVAFAISGTNDAPVVITDNIATLIPYGQPADFPSSWLLANASDPEGDSLTVIGAGTAVNGVVALNGGVATFTPDAGFSGDASFNFTTSDGHGGLTDAQMLLYVARQPLTITASPPSNDVIEAGAQGAGQPYADATLTATAGGQPVHLYYDLRAWTLNPTPVGPFYSAQGTYGTFYFEPGSGSFSYALDNTLAATNALKQGQVVTDGMGVEGSDGTENAIGGVTFTIIGANDAPIALADTVQAVSGVATAISTAALLVNDSDPEGDAFSLTAVGSASHGTVAFANGQVTFTPTTGFTGKAGFSYTVTDSHGAASTAQVTVNVAGAAQHLPSYINHSGSTAAETMDFTGDNIRHQFVAGSGDTFVLTGSAGSSVRLGAGKGTVVGGSGQDTVTFGPGVGTVTGGAGPDAFIFVKGQIADPATHGGQYDTVTDYVGAGGWVPGRDFIWLDGFSKATTHVTYEHDLAGDATAHLYRIDDGAYHAEFVLQYAGPGARWNLPSR